MRRFRVGERRKVSEYFPDSFAIIKQPQHAAELDGAEAQEPCEPGFYKIQQEAEGKVTDEEQLEPIAVFKGYTLFEPCQGKPEQSQECNLVKSHWVSGAVTKINTENGRGWEPIGLFRETTGKAADTADDHGEDQGIGEEVAGRLFLAQDLFGQLYA